MKRVLVIGGGYAGVLTALRLSRKADPGEIEVELVAPADHFVERIRLHQIAAGQELPLIPFRELLAGTGIHLVQGWVTRILPETREITVRAPGGELSLGYDVLVYALGSMVDVERIPGGADGILTLGSEETSRAAAVRLAEVAARGGRLLVCGGGLTGIEAAPELAEAYVGLDVSLVTRGEFGEQLSELGCAHVRRVFKRCGIEILDGRSVERFCSAPGGSPTRLENPANVGSAAGPGAPCGATGQAECDDGSRVPFDACLWAGPYTVPGLARDAGLEVSALGRIRVDPYLRSLSHPEIFAVGDSASPGEALGVPIRMSCATAQPMSFYLGEHLAALIREEEDVEPHSYHYAMRCISLGRRDGLIQWVEPDDTPLERVITGLAAARIKEVICWGTTLLMQEDLDFAPIRYWE